MVESSTEPEVMLNFFQGFLSINTKPMYGAKGEKFQQVWNAEKGALDLAPLHSAAGYTAEIDGDCSDLCGYMYDAVWAASFAVSAALEVKDGQLTLDKPGLNADLRALSFTGATGTLSFAETGDRNPGGITVIFYNWVRNLNSSSIDLVDLWEWDADRGQIPLGPVPVWGGGVVSREAPPDGQSCGAGYVYSTADLKCLACAPGSHERGGKCVLCEVGKVAPGWGLSLIHISEPTRPRLI
eukprot:2956560-Rhodomonas_salina.2